MPSLWFYITAIPRKDNMPRHLDAPGHLCHIALADKGAQTRPQRENRFMIVKTTERNEMARPKVWGGLGEVLAKYYLGPNAGGQGESFSMASEMTLAPGHSIGVHPHDNDEEIYVLLAGQADYTDEHGAVHRLRAGDLALTRRGQSHGIVNPGPENLTFLAIITR